MSTVLIKQLAERLIKAERLDENSRRKEVESINAECKLNNISPNSIANYAMENIESYQDQAKQAEADSTFSNTLTLSAFTQVWQQKNPGLSVTSREFSSALSTHTSKTVNFDYHH